MNNLYSISDLHEALDQGVYTREHIEDKADRLLQLVADYNMVGKLKEARLKGRQGWWNEKECSLESLRKMLNEHIEKGDMLDVMNFAAMIYVRENPNFLREI